MNIVTPREDLHRREIQFLPKRKLDRTADLRESEVRFVRAMQDLGHGRFECLRIAKGELILDPWPTTIRSIKFGNPSPNGPASAPADFELKNQVSEFFALIRCIESGLIHVLEVRGGLPFVMEVADHLCPRRESEPILPLNRST